MSDVALRSAERAVALGEPGARERLIREQLRAGAPDPRLDPRAGAEVEALGRYNGRHSSRVRREVIRVWPGRLAISLPAILRSEWTRTERPPLWLRQGAPVLAVAERSWRGEGAERRADTWSLVASSVPGTWSDYVVCDEPEVYGPGSILWRDCPSLPVESVEWLHCGRGRRIHPARSSLAQWRKWAKGGTVLYLGRGA